MKRFFEIITILLLCSFTFYANFSTSIGLVFSILLAILFACFQTIFSNRKLSIVFCIVFFAIGFLHTPTLFFLPAVLYDLCYYDLNYQSIGLLFIFLVTLVLLPATSLPLFILISVISCYISYNSHIQEKQIKALFDLRDNSIETNNLLKKKNQIIQKQQTDLIYTTTLSERNRIAREIHDNVGHMLTRSILQLGALKAMNKEEMLAPLFENLLSSLNQAMTSIRNSVHDLHDESINLKQSIEQLFSTASERFQIHFNYSMSEPIPKEIKYSFISIIKEALTNACKYSNGNTIEIVLVEHPAFYQLMIQDNGTNIRDNSDSGMGLLNMRDRVASLSGTIKITTNDGFRIFISILKEAIQ